MSRNPSHRTLLGYRIDGHASAPSYENLNLRLEDQPFEWSYHHHLLGKLCGTPFFGTLAGKQGRSTVLILSATRNPILESTSSF